ncbi:Uncharacterised protein [Mycobacteroides abscessus subsp. abscessus]|nr:Uncharacterised protein [Mycobacteroides abscessus subsp. abscessus]
MPLSAAQYPRRNWRLPAGADMASVRTASWRVRAGVNPIAARSGSRMNTSNDTSALTGLPGSVSTGTPLT